MDLSKSLRIALAEKGKIKHKDVAKSLGVSPQQISNWLTTGIIKNSRLIDVATYFGMRVSEFVALGEKNSDKTRS